MSTTPIACRKANCGRLVQSAIPFPGVVQPSQFDFNPKKYCSRSCATQDVSNIITCRSKNCKRLVRNATPIPSSFQSSSPDFNIRDYCSKSCFWSNDEDLEDDGSQSDIPQTTPLITCDICASEKPLTEYIQFTGTFSSIWERDTTILIPTGCHIHILPELSDEGHGVCIKCIKRHILIQFRDRGPAHITCVHQHNGWDFPRVDWGPYAHSFLPKKLHKEYDRRSFEAWWNRANKWECPSGCETIGVVLDSLPTRGYPHVECSECRGRFCATCRIPWHAGISCQQYRAEHPQILEESEKALLKEMATLGARHCPQCQWIIVKDGGCSHMMCERCRCNFTWPSAEKVRAPPLDDNKGIANVVEVSPREHEDETGHIGAEVTEDTSQIFLANTIYDPAEEEEQEGGNNYMDYESDSDDLDDKEWVPNPRLCEIDGILAGAATSTLQDTQSW